MEFWKMHGAGNDFIVTDNRESQIALLEKQKSELARLVCNRHFGIGADGFILAEGSISGDIRMAFYNADGSVAAMCGNGLRCFSKFVFDKGMVNSAAFRVETGDGIKEVEIKTRTRIESVVSVNMGAWDGKVSKHHITALDQNYEVLFLHMGVPHAVIFLNHELSGSSEAVPEIVSKYGPIIERNPLFKEGTNVNFVYIVDKDHIRVNTWERGAGMTLACGTGACASAVLSNKLKDMSDQIDVDMPGGSVRISVLASNTVFMEGPVNLICEGIFEKNPNKFQEEIK